MFKKKKSKKPIGDFQNMSPEKKELMMEQAKTQMKQMGMDASDEQVEKAFNDLINNKGMFKMMQKMIMSNPGMVKKMMKDKNVDPDKLNDLLGK